MLWFFYAIDLSFTDIGIDCPNFYYFSKAQYILNLKCVSTSNNKKQLALAALPATQAIIFTKTTLAWSKGPQGSGTAEFAEKLAVFGVGGAMALPVASVAGSGLLSLGAQSTETASLTYSMMFRNGIMRLAVRNSLGRFAVGNGTRLTGSVFSQYYGLNGLGQATQFTPLVSRSIPVLVRWVIGLGGTGGITYWGYQKIIN